MIECKFFSPPATKAVLRILYLRNWTGDGVLIAEVESDCLLNGALLRMHPSSYS